MEEREKLFGLCDPNGNGFCSVAEIGAAFQDNFNYRAYDHGTMKTFEDAFNAAKNYSKKETGPAADYVERREFRICLEIFTKKLASEEGEPDDGEHE